MSITTSVKSAIQSQEDVQVRHSEIQTLIKKIAHLYEMSDDDLGWEHICNGDHAKNAKSGWSPTANEYREEKTAEYAHAILDAVRPPLA